MAHASDNSLGEYLRKRRQKLDPATFGFAAGRRRTPGLRREEVAQRANISATWYTWLEQGRGGSPSADVLDRIAKAMLLTEVEREHLFFLGLGRAPEVRYRGPDTITPRLQRFLDTLPNTPAIIRTATWDIVAWNQAASAVILDFASLPPRERNMLRILFCDARLRAAQFDWETFARFLVSAFRVDAARAGASMDVEPLVRELCVASPEFAAMWREHVVQSHDSDGMKRLRHPTLGTMAFECSIFAVDSRPDLQLVILNPATVEDRRRVESLTTKAAAKKKRRALREPRA